MTKVTASDITKMNELYAIYHTYAEVARQTGFSATTVKKYIIKEAAAPKVLNLFDTSKLNPVFDITNFIGRQNFGDLCELSPQEIEEIKQLWEELPQ